MTTPDPEPLRDEREGSASAGPWYANGLRFACVPGCTRCCSGAPGDVFVSDEEIGRIAAFLRMDESEFRACHVRPAGSGRQSLRERGNGDCAMLDRSGCSAYPVRPLQCSSYPFWPEVVASPEAWARDARTCPGMNDGPLRPLAEIEAALKAWRGHPAAKRGG